MRFISSILLIVLMGIAISAATLMAQPADAVYVNNSNNNNSASVPARSVTNPTNVHHSVTTNKKPNDLFATVSCSSLLTAAVFHLNFPNVITSTTAKPVTVYIRTNEIASTFLGGALSIKAYNNITGESNEASISKQEVYHLSDKTIFLAITVNASFQSVRLSLTGPLAGTNSINVYYAFYGPTAVNSSNPYPYNVADCGLPNVTTTRIDAGLLSLLAIDNLTHAIDNNATETQSSFKAILGVSGLTNSLKMRQIFYFNGPSHTNDAVRFILSKTAPLLSATLLGKISVQAYRGDTLSGSAQVLGSVLDANLLGLFDTGPITFFLTPRDNNGNPVRFDRVEVTLEVSGLTLNLGAIPLNIHDVRRVPSQPQITNTTTNVCDNVGTIVLSAVSNLDNLLGNLSYKWYNSAGAQSASDKNLSLSQLTTPGTVSYYVDIKKDGCETASGRRKVDITVTKAPTTPPVNLTP